MILCTILYLFWRKAKVVWKQIIQSMIIGNVVDHWPDISENVFSNCLVTLTNDMTIVEIAHTGLLKWPRTQDMILVGIVKVKLSSVNTFNIHSFCPVSKWLISIRLMAFLELFPIALQKHMAAVLLFLHAIWSNDISFVQMTRKYKALFSTL